MLGRLKFNFDAAIDIMLDSIPTEMYESTTTTFCDPCMGGGQLVAAIEAKLREYGHDDENIASRVFGYEENQIRVRYARNKYNLISTLDTMSVEEGISMKFNVIIANPPYEGQKSLHQRFFNKAVEEMVIDGGTVCFLQPAVIYHNKKENPRKPTVQMRNHVLENTVQVYFVNSSVFKNAAITGQCSVTVLTKDETNSGVIEYVQTVSGSTFKDVDLEYINQQEMDVATYKSIVEKIKAASTNGTLHTICQDSSDGEIFALPKVRGHSGTNDFYTFIPRDGFDTTSDWGIAIDGEYQKDNVRTYLKTFIARFAFSIRKYSVHLYAGELSLVPLVDFNQEWTDEKLMAKWGITEEEYAEILKVIPAYYD